MPTYTYRNNDTGEVEDKLISWAENLEYLKDNPHIDKIMMGAPAVSYSASGDVNILKRAGDGWKEVQDRIKNGLPPSLKDNIRTK